MQVGMTNRGLDNKAIIKIGRKGLDHWVSALPVQENLSNTGHVRY